MLIISAILMGVGLAMDAFAVSVTNGITQKRSTLIHAAATAAAFGIAQGVMPLIGWLLGSSFAGYIRAVDHWLALILLCAIGGNMIWEAIKEGCGSEEDGHSEFNIRLLFFSAVATSIDALVVGISFPLSGVSTLIDSAITCGIIAAITFAFCLAGFYIRKIFGSICKKGAQIAGGAILIGLGIKILVEHMFFS